MHVYGEGLRKARALLPDPLDHRSIRVDMKHNEDPGYPRAFAELGVNDHCGLWEANCAPWLGMPEFPYYASPEDCRKVNQGGAERSSPTSGTSVARSIGSGQWIGITPPAKADLTERNNAWWRPWTSLRT